MENLLNFIKDYQSIITVIISSAISYYIAKAKAKNEIDKLLLTLSHNDKNNFSNSFKQLISTTSNYCQYPTCPDLEEAIKANADFMSQCPKEFHPLASELDSALNDRNIEQINIIRQKLISLYSKRINQSK